jgi:hypothetical protein
MSSAYVEVRRSPVSAHPDTLALRVARTGEITSHKECEQVGSGEYFLAEDLLPTTLSLHASLIEELGHRGDVVVVACNRWPTSSGLIEHIGVARGPIPLETVKSPEFLSVLQRELARADGRWEFEPEP